MSRTALGRRLAVSALALVTAAGGLALLAPSANAASTTRLVLTPSTQSAAAGTCVVYTLQPLDANGVQATDAATATVELAESPENGTQDVDFCTVPNVTTGPATATYTNSAQVVGPAQVAAGSSQSYAPGESVTPNPSRGATSGNPDAAADADSVTASQTAGNNNNNPSGVDRAEIRYSGGVVRFGVAGLVAGGATIRAFVNTATGTGATTGPDPGEPFASGATTFREGGLPGSAAAADAARVVDAEPEESSAQQGTAQQFTAIVRNGSGDTLAGVTPRIRVTSGANVAAGNQVRADCGETNNAGVAPCTFQGAQVGTDTLTVYVEQTAGGTAGPDASEPRDDIVRSTTIRAVGASQARFLDLSPDRTTTVSGASRVFTVSVTSATGAPVSGATIGFTEEGPGRFSNGQSSVAVVTGGNGAASATVLTTAAESGQQVITASLFDQASTQCNQPAGRGTDATASTPAGNCADTSVNIIAPAATASPSATPTASASASPSATATRSASPSASPDRVLTEPVLTLERSTITAQEGAVVNATAEPGSVVELHAYSRPSTTYRVARRAVVGESGRLVFRINPSGNTRMFLRSRSVEGGTPVDSDSIVLTVRTSINLKVARVGTQTYRFTGSTLPKRRGQLVTVFYQADGGNRVIASRARVSENGTYNVTRRFGGRGTFTLFTATGTDINNAGNESNRVRTAIR